MKRGRLDIDDDDIMDEVTIKTLTAFHLILSQILSQAASKVPIVTEYLQTDR